LFTLKLTVLWDWEGITPASTSTFPQSYSVYKECKRKPVSHFGKNKKKRGISKLTKFRKSKVKEPFKITIDLSPQKPAPN